MRQPLVVVVSKTNAIMSSPATNVSTYHMEFRREQAISCREGKIVGQPPVKMCRLSFIKYELGVVYEQSVIS